jgi:hypothetical protein
VATTIDAGGGNGRRDEIRALPLLRFVEPPKQPRARLPEGKMVKGAGKGKERGGQEGDVEGVREVAARRCVAPPRE